MDGFFRSARRVGIVAVALLSIAAGLALVHALITPKQIQGVRTAVLLLIVALFVLPLGAMGALWLDRIAVRKALSQAQVSPGGRVVGNRGRRRSRRGLRPARAVAPVRCEEA